MTKTIKESGLTVKILKQYRGQSNNYKEDSKVYADLFKTEDSNGTIRILCESELAD